ncbi:LuxR C-terminal-related transcriptional regulator [Photorhabdus sp. P32]|uniref:LuxR C-terminal-related transcriptional regulator n=1 Tax=Photorhabdus sp. P32 TaxID=3117549 RepID=UPI00311ABE6E
MNKSYSVSTQIINTMEQSNEPWGIKDKNSCFIYGNLALKSIKDFSSSFEFEGLYDHELPWAGAEFAKERVAHDRKVMEKEERICSLETHVFGKDKFLSSYFCEKTPIYHEDGSCMGTIFHGWQAKEYSLTYLYQYYDKLPPSILLQPPSDLFTQREWDIIFFFLQKQPRKQIGEILNITHREVEEHMARIYRKIGIHSDQQLAEYCHANNFNHYIPERFLLS